MGTFCIGIAGRVAWVHALFDSTRDYCRDYLTEEAPDFTVAVTREDMAREQEWLRQEALEEGLRPRVFTDPFLERTVIQRKVAQALLAYDTLLIHGSAVAVDGRGYLFTAKCGTGKSTHTRFWREVFGSRAVMINDDKPFLRITAEGALVCGAPWSGKHGLHSNITVPLQGICILDRGTENRIARLAPEEARSILKNQCQQPLTREDLLETLLEKVGLWHMFCTKDPAAAGVSHGAMKEG